MKDYAVERGLMVVIISLLNIVPAVLRIRDTPPDERTLRAGSEVGSDVAIIFVTLILLAVLFSSQELIGRPRKQGFYRLIFAKPVNPVAFYAQLFVVHLVGTVALVSAIAGLFSVVAIGVSIPHIAALAALAFVLFGGVGFLASAFFNYDSFVVIVAVGLSVIGKSIAAARSGVGVKFANILIPIDHLAGLRPLILGGPVAGADVAWVLGYGLIAFVLGMFAVRYSQLSD